MTQLRGALLCAILLPLLPFVISDGYKSPSAADDAVLAAVNDYRVKEVGIAPLAGNKGAACLAHAVADKFQGTPCTNETGADTKFGQNPQFGDQFKNWLDSCHVDLTNAQTGYVAPNCVPDGNSPQAASIAAMNMTQSPIYQQQINDSTYTSAGVGSNGVWFVLVLATNASDGNYDTSGDSSEGVLIREQVPVFTSIVLVFAAMFATLQW